MKDQGVWRRIPLLELLRDARYTPDWSPGAEVMSAKDSSVASWIQKTPGVIGGDACVRNTRIAVWMLVVGRRLGMSDDELRTRYDPPITKADLDAAWDYYRNHPEEIEQAIRQHEEA